MKLRPTPVAGAAAGVVFGLAASALLAVTGALPDPESDGSRTDERAVAQLLEAWERSRLGTYVVVSTFTRRVEGRTGLESVSVLAQRPPERLVQQFGSVTARDADRRIDCTTGPDERVRCKDAGPARPYEQEVEADVRALEGYVEGSEPLYVVDRVDGCFRLRLRVEYPFPPLGEEARYCFDRETGALSRTEIVRAEGTDVTEAIEVRAEVRDGDLVPPQSEG